MREPIYLPPEPPDPASVALREAVEVLFRSVVVRRCAETLGVGDD